MDLCEIPIEIFMMIAEIDVTITTTLRLTSRVLSNAIKLPTIVPLSSRNGKSRYLIFTTHGEYKLQQLYCNGVMEQVKFGERDKIATIDTKRCLDNPMMSDISSRGSLKMIIPRGNRARRSIHNGNLITYFYCAQRTSNGSLITTRTLIHIKNIANGNQSYKIWMGDHYKVLEYDPAWKLLRDIYEEARIPPTHLSV
jgi:hypothetical protein